MAAPHNVSERDCIDAYICQLKAEADASPKRISELMGIPESEVHRLLEIAKTLNL